MFLSRNNNSKAFTFIEVLVGTALLLIVFMGIFSVYRLGMKVVFQSKARIIATSLANQKIEEIRNLSYGNVGTFHCQEEHLECEYGDEWFIEDYPAGPIKGEQTIDQNNINYTVFTDVDYGINCSDGVGGEGGEECREEYDDSCPEIPCPADDCPNDYKKVKITISWNHPYTGKINLETTISPKTERQECEEIGGFLIVKVRDSLSQAFSFPRINTENLLTYQIDTAKPDTGEHTFVLPPASRVYKIIVSKDEPCYSSVSTYGIGDEYQGKIITFPFHRHASVIENDFWEESYYIDKVSSFFVETFSHAETENFSDPFNNEDNISEKFQIVIAGEEIALEESAPGIYYESGYAISSNITPPNLVLWEDVFFTDTQPDLTEIRYHILYDTGVDWQTIPDFDLPGNEIGFEYSPINLFDLSPTTYPSLKIKADFLTTDTSLTPILYDWEIIWSITDSIPVGNIDFDIHSEKIVGKDSGGFNIYKYDESASADISGHAELSNLEWDKYYFSNFSISGAGLDLVKTRPEMSAENSIYLPADTIKNLKMFLETPYSLLLEVNDLTTGEGIEDADAHLYNIGISYDKNQPTNPDGGTIFFNLENDTYELEITADGYEPFPDPFIVGPILISGKEVQVVELTPTP